MENLSATLRAGLALNRNGFKPTHSLGQNFIMDESFLEHLLEIAMVDNKDNVLEIGPGPGILTSLIAERARRVLAIETDQRLEPVLSEMLGGYENASFVIRDALKTNINALLNEKFEGEDYRVVANLPYYITADLILKMLSLDKLPDTICVMVQKEAAERIMSHPGDKNWTAFSATVNYFCDCVVLEDVPPTRFNPMPHVDSCFIRLDIKNDRLVERAYESGFVKMIQACFLMRRKTLANNLKASYGLSLAEASEIIVSAGLPEKVRGEVLTLEEMASLYRMIKQKQGV